jgi:hypothetical protein
MTSDVRDSLIDQVQEYLETNSQTPRDRISSICSSRHQVVVVVEVVVVVRMMLAKESQSTRLQHEKESSSWVTSFISPNKQQTSKDCKSPPTRPGWQNAA